MPSVTKKDLQAVINSGTAQGAYYLYGADNYSTAKAFRELRRSVTDDDESLNLHAFQGKGIDIDAVIEACESVPVFAEKLCVTVCDLDLEVNKIPDSKLKPLYEEIKDLPETTVLIFYTSTTDITGGKKGVTEKNKKLFTAVEKSGSTVRFDIPTANEAVKEITARCRENGVNIDRRAAEQIFSRCKSDLVLSLSEADKLSSYTDNITPDTVALLTPENDDTKVYALTDTIAAGNMSRAVEIYNKLIENRTDPIYLLYVITGSMTDIYRARLAIDFRRSEDDVKNDFGYARNMAFRVTNAFRSARKTDLKRLHHALDVLMKADLDMKTGTGSPETILENAIIKLFV